MSLPCNRISLLYVDDEQSLLDLAKAFLELEGEFTVSTITSAKEALKILAEGHFDAIISDYQMPEMDGIELLKSIRSRYPDLPFIIFTGKGREEVVIQAIDAGADYYVQKGNDIRSQFRELSYKIKLAVEKRHVDTALKASEERFRSVVEDQTEFICRFTPDGKLTFVNDAYCRYFDLDKSSSVGAPQSVVIPLDDLQQMKQHLHSLTPENPVATIEHRIVKPVGEIRWQQWSDRAIYDVKGNIIEYQSVGHDITHRKTAEQDLRKKNDELHAAYEQLTATEEELRTNFEDLVKSQHALQESEERYRNVVEDQTEFICRFTPEGTHNFVNEAYCRYFKKSRDEIIGKKFKPDILQEDTNLVRDHFLSLKKENPIASIDHRIIMPDGKFRWQRWSDRAIFNDGGALIEYQSVGRDITDTKRNEEDLLLKNIELQAAYEQIAATEEELRSSYNDLAESQRSLEDKEITLNAILLESPIPQFVIDRDHKILYWNHALAAQSGIMAHEVTGTDQQWRAFYPSGRPCLADLLVDESLDTIPEWYADKYAKFTLIDNAYEVTDFFPQMGKAGKWLHFTAGLIKNRNGDIIGAVESLEDITDRKTTELNLRNMNDELHAAYEQLTATEEELRSSYDDLVKSRHALQESEDRYRNIVEDQTEFICRFKPEGIHNFVNDAYCRHFGMQRLELIGQKFIPEIPKEDRGLLRSYFASLTGENPVGTIEHRIILPDGSVRWHQWSDRAIFDEYGTLVEYQSVGRDITDWKTVELDLRKKNDELRRAYEQCIAR